VTDFTLDYDGGTVGRLTPETQAARDWINDHVESEPYQWLGPALCIESRYIAPIVERIVSDGLEVT
jgi:hypothetical protein